MTTSNTNNAYQVYMNQVLDLARTICIKSLDTVNGMNQQVIDQHGETAVDTTDPTSWRYYNNVAGDYHSTDTMMYVTSLDTLETIEFTKENLEVHTATKKGYAYGTRYYQALVNQYPWQEILILGILNPADMDTAIAAADWTILAYPPELVEANEYTFIQKLQTAINNYKYNWTNDQFAVTDNLYPTVSIGIMYLMLVPAIINIRLAACKTREAHSYHVKQYLGSHEGLDQFSDFMSLSQSLWTYRNITYIERNPGRVDTFQWLTEHIMTERNIPLAEYSMYHDLTDQPVNLYPTVMFQRTALNLGYNVDTKDQITLEAILDKEDPLQQGNPKYHAEHEDEIQSQMENSLSNKLETKALESSMIDYSDNTPYTMTSILLNNWLDMSARGLYESIITIGNPRTGELIPLNAFDAYCFMWYAFCASWGNVLEQIPVVVALRVPRIPTPTINDLLSVVDSNYIGVADAKAALVVMPPNSPVVSITAFYQHCQDLFNAAQAQRFQVAAFNHMDARGYAQGMVNRLYSDNTWQLGSGVTTYTEWFAQRSITISDWTQEDLGLAYTSIVQDATGLSLTNTISLKNLQAAMVGIMTRLSSYSIQFMKSINDSAILVPNNPAIRLGDMWMTQEGLFYVDGLNVIWDNLRGELWNTFSYDLDAFGDAVGSMVYNQMHWEIPNVFHLAHIPVSQPLQWNMGGWRATVTPPTPKNAEGVIPVPGIPEWLNLTPAQQSTFKDVYGSQYNNGY